ncbi:MAG: DUF3299 domain-containing protein [Phycisphaerales bacterium]
MKLFWSLLLVICLAGFAAVFWPVSKSPSKDVDEFANAKPPQSVAPLASSTNSSATNKTTPTVDVTPIASNTSSATANTSSTNNAKNSSATASPASAAAITQSAPTTASVATITAAPIAPSANKATSPTVAISPNSLKDGLDRKFGSAIIVPGNILKQADGSILADNKYLITGAGTMEDPYRVTWECLTSASQTYIPRLQQNNIPQRVAMLDGKWIRIEGYMAFPLMLQESSEILAMLNQWDGCCIGVPPTPYDAIEVKLSVPVKPGRRHTYNFGTVTGKFKVDPYLVENWLVGLYQLESASLQSDM